MTARGRAVGRRGGVTAAAIACGAALALFLFWPLSESLRGAFLDGNGRFTLAYIGGVFRDPIYRAGLANALGIAFGATLVANVVGIGTALLLDRCQFVGRRLLGALVPLPLMVPPFVGAVGIKQILGQAGALNAVLIRAGLLDAAHPIDWLRAGRFAVVVLLTALHLYPVVFLNVQAALASVNVETEEAAAGLGARGLRLFRKVTLPAILPSVFGSTSIILIWGLTELGVPLVCDFQRVTSVQIFAGLKDIGRNPLVYALVVLLLVATVALYAATRLLIGRNHGAAAVKGARRRQPRRLSVAGQVAAAGALGLVVGAAALPNLAVVLLALARDWYATVLPVGLTLDHVRLAIGHEMVIPSIGNSLRYVTLSTLLDLLLGGTIAFLVVRTRSRFSALLDAGAMLPLAIPGLVMAFGYLAVSREGRPLSFLNPIVDPTALLVVAYAVRRLPFVVRSAAAGLAQISVTLEEAAASLGAGPLRTLGRVTVPLLAPHLLAGGVFAFALSMLEVSDSLLLAQRQAAFPITKAIYELFQSLGEGRALAAALGLWAMLFLIAAIACARSLLGRKLGGFFRL
ncbi:MAG TPA: iron ABC transporter permease [Polyangia bacterium]|nr:iron ABC transporter permease [Polyangia bacterium]